MICDIVYVDIVWIKCVKLYGNKELVQHQTDRWLRLEWPTICERSFCINPGIKTPEIRIFHSVPWSSFPDPEIKKSWVCPPGDLLSWSLIFDIFTLIRQVTDGRVLSGRESAFASILTSWHYRVEDLNRSENPDPWSLWLHPECQAGWSFKALQILASKTLEITSVIWWSDY